MQRPSLYRDLLFGLMLFAGMYLCGWTTHLNAPQGEPHLWRQSDCLSITEYYQKGNGFFSPEMHCRMSDGFQSGKTVAEFPVLYYIVGKLWAIFGKHIWIFRLLSLIISTGALICLYRMLLRITKSWYWSALGPLLLLSSPVYAFYGIGFLTNVPALNCAIFALYFFLRFYDTKRNAHLVYAMLLFAMAGLLKISALESYFFLLVLFVAEKIRLFRFRSSGKIFEQGWKQFLILLIPIVICAAWYRGFVEHYCFVHGGRYSFTEPMPIWGYDKEARAVIWSQFFRFTMHQIFPLFLWIFFVGAAVYMLCFFRRLHRIWLVSLPLLFAGHVAFSFLFFFCLDGHDYYHADVLLFFLGIYAALIHFLSKNEPVVLESRVVKAGFGLLVVYALAACGSNMMMRFHGSQNNKLMYRLMMGAQPELEYIWYFSDRMPAHRVYERVGKEIGKYGFAPDDPVIAINDPSFNSFLYLMDRPGFTNMANIAGDSAFTAQRIAYGAKLMTVEYPENEQRTIKAFMGHKLFQIEHIAVYDLRPYASQVKKP